MELPKEAHDHFVITGIEGYAPYYTKLIGFKNDEPFGKAMANAAKKLIYILFSKNVTYRLSRYGKIIAGAPLLDSLLMFQIF